MALREGRLCVEILPNAIAFRVVAENGTAGVEDALDKIEQLAVEMEAQGIIHEVHQRKYHDGYRIDTVVVMTQIYREMCCEKAA